MRKILEEKLINAAILGVKNFYQANDISSKRRFGAAVLTNMGNIYHGTEYYSDTFTLLLHAEQAALAHAACHGEYGIVALAVTGSNPDGIDDPIYPCHMCKQLLWESYLRSKINTEIILHNEFGLILDRVNLLDMISFPWPKVVNI